ncbi:MAG: hypothetical protein U0939_20120 [Pirellulales bacterium]
MQSTRSVGTGVVCDARRWASRFVVGAVLTTLACTGRTAHAQAAEAIRSPAELFPESTWLYAEVPAPPKLVAALYDHPVADKVQNDEQFQPLLATPEYAKFRLGLGVAELAMGMSWRKAVEQLTAGGTAIGVDGKTGGVAVVSRASDAKSLEKILQLALKLSGDEARKKGQPEPVQRGEYRGIVTYQLDKVRFAVHGPWLVATENEELGKQLLDRLLSGDDAAATLARSAAFGRAQATRSEGTLAWSCVRLDWLRESGKAADLFRPQAENAAAEFLFGPLMVAAKKAEFVTAGVERVENDFVVKVAAPFELSWVPEERSYIFGEKGDGLAPALLRPAGTILNFTTHRDLSALWNSGPDLFDEKANAELNQANSNLSTLFSGRDFAQDVLGSLRPEWQVVVARQDYSKAASIPDMKLPAGALVVQLREPEKTRREWKVTFQSLIGFLNVVSSMQGQPPLELDSEKLDGIQLVTASYLPPEEGKKPAPHAMQYNFSPSLAMTDERMVIASTRQLALDLARSPEAAASAAPGDAASDSTAAEQPVSEPAVNSRLSIDAGPLREALLDNREQLIARNMLEKGHARIAAEAEIDLLLKAAELVRGLDVRLQRAGRNLELQLRLGL